MKFMPKNLARLQEEYKFCLEDPSCNGSTFLSSLLDEHKSKDLNFSLEEIEHFLMYGYPTIVIADDPKKGELVLLDSKGNKVSENFNPYNDFETWRKTGNLLKAHNESRNK